MPYQRTIAQKIGCTGIGIHTGAPVALSLLPAPVNHGVVFVRREGERCVEIPASPEFIVSTANATTLAREGVQVATVEHLLAALRGFGVDNLRVEVDGAEVPAMDGSAASFVYLLQTAGTLQQEELRQVIVVSRPLVYADGLRSIRIEPGRRGFAVRYAVDFAHPAIGRQELEITELTPNFFVEEIAGARTFGFHAQLDSLRQAGLAGGASLDNTIVLDEAAVMNAGGLRWPDEFVRHKVLDLVGDFALLGYPIRARVEVERGGHALHRAGVRALLENRDAWSLAADPEPLPATPLVPAEFVSPI